MRPQPLLIRKIVAKLNRMLKMNPKGNFGLINGIINKMEQNTVDRISKNCLPFSAKM